MPRTIDRAANPIVNQGSVDAGAEFDTTGLRAIKAKNRITPSAYSGVDVPQVHNIDPMDLLFTVPGHTAAGKSKLAVMAALNGQGVAGTAYYPNDPEMQRECLRNEIQFIGGAKQALDVGPETVQLGITVQIGGLKTFVLGDEEPFVKPGDLLFADVPLPGRAGSGVGAPAAKTTLQLRRCSTDSPARSLRRHIRNILEDPRQWKSGMGAHLQGTAAWATAAHDALTSAIATGVFFVRECIAKRVLAPTAQALASIIPTSTTVAYAAAARGANNAALAAPADGIAVAIAGLVGIVPAVPGQRVLAPNNALDKDYLKLRIEFLQRNFYDGTNIAYEFGHSIQPDGRHVFAGRDGSNKNVVQNAYGKLLLVQLNHWVRAGTAMYAAIQQRQRMIVGTSTSGGSKKGSNQTHVQLGKNKG